MIDREKIKQGVVKMFKVNMGLKAGEKVLVVTDVPTTDDWRKKSTEQLTDLVQRTLLAKAVSEIASESFPECPVEFYAYPSVGRHGTEPGPEVAEKLKTAEVLIAITSYSLSHTEAREGATKAGVRVASMPVFLADMFYPGGPMDADYTKIEEETEKLAKLITDAREVIVRTSAGTDLKFGLKGRTGDVDAGIYTRRGAWGNLPSGEAYIAPVEGTAEGRVVVEKGWCAGLTENMTLMFRGGEVVEVLGGGKVGDEYRELLKPGVEEEPYKSRRNFAELGIGTNPNARRPDNVLEAEKIKGTVHVAVGDNAHMGGKVTADLHQDFVLPKPDLYIDGKLIMKNGKFMYEKDRAKHPTMGFRVPRLRRPPYLQIALDIPNIERTKGIVEELPESDRIILEVGTPLLKKYGVKVIRDLRELVGDAFIVADLKTLDAGKVEVDLAFEETADAAVVSGLAATETVDKFIYEAKRLGIYAVVDMMNVEDPIQKLRSLEEFPDIVILHRAIDVERRTDKTRWELIKEMREAFKGQRFLVAVAGGITPETAPEALAKGADIIIVGRYITQSRDVERSVRELLECTKEMR